MRRRWQRALLAGALGVVLLVGGCLAIALGGAPAGPVGSGGQPGPSRPATAPASPRNDAPSATPAQGEPDRPDGVPRDTQEITVRRVVDGDTLEVAAVAAGATLAATTQVDVRLLEIDTPETRDPSEPVQCYGKPATRALQRMLPTGSRAWVQRDQQLRDAYDRYLLYVWNDDGRFVNLAMVRRGYARAVLYEPNDRHWPRISAAERDVRYAERGLWGACARFGEPADPAAPGAGEAEPAPEQPPAADGYPVPPPPPDRDCSDVPESRFEVRPGDPHRFDRDGDGIGCES